MTAPRQVLPGVTYLTTRRCTQREFLLKPSRLTCEIFLYVLALAAERFGIELHVFCVLSNHYHLVLTDPNARLPAFQQFLDALVARAVNASLGRWETFWAPSSYSAVALESPSDVVDKIAYVLANPVSAGLVRSAAEWPGLWSRPDQLGGEPIRVPRPSAFFRASGYLPDEVELRLTAPPGFESPEAFRESVARALADREEAARSALGEAGRTFLGAAKVLAQRWWARPASAEPRRSLNPRVAARDRWKRVEALTRLAEFVDAYREAWSRMRAGVRGALFPAGTYLLRVQHGVRCEAPS